MRSIAAARGPRQNHSPRGASDRIIQRAERATDQSARGAHIRRVWKVSWRATVPCSGAEEDVASGDAVGIWNPSTPSLPSVRREIYFSCNDGSVQAQQNQLALWFSLGIWFSGMMIMSCLCCPCLPMCAIERDGKRSQSTEMNQSNQLFHNLSPPSLKMSTDLI